LAFGEPIVNEVPILEENDELALNDPVLPLLMVLLRVLGMLTGADCRLVRYLELDAMLFIMVFGDGDLDSCTGCIGTGTGGLLRQNDFFRTLISLPKALSLLYRE
jgi:hypothetical protein